MTGHWTERPCVCSVVTRSETNTSHVCLKRFGQRLRMLLSVSSQQIAAFFTKKTRERRLHETHNLQK